MGFKIIFHEMKKKLMTADPSVIKGFLAIQVTMTGLGGGIFYIEVKDGVLSVEPYDYQDRNAQIIISVSDLQKLAEGKLDAIEAFNDGRVEVEGSIEKALEFNELIKTIKR